MAHRPYEWREDGRLTDSRRERRTKAPAGLCGTCWRQRRGVPGLAWVRSWPGRDGRVYVCVQECMACAARAQRVGFRMDLATPDQPNADAFLEAVDSLQATIAERDALTLRRKKP